MRFALNTEIVIEFTIYQNSQFSSFDQTITFNNVY